MSKASIVEYTLIAFKVISFHNIKMTKILRILFNSIIAIIIRTLKY